MCAKQAYDRPMRYWTRASTFFVAIGFALSAHGQVNGVPPSVTSYGFGGHPGFNGTPPSVTSLGPNGLSQPRSPGIHQPRPPQRPGQGNGGRGNGGQANGTHHHHDDVVLYPYFVPYYPAGSPYYGDAPDDQASADPPEQYQGGPTIFDRRGPGTPLPNDYVTDPPPAHASRQDPAPFEEAQADPPAPPAPVAAEPSTILIFKDGHKVEVGNYAIVGSNLFDLTPGHRQKLALADLDMPATEKANEDLGNDFKLPKLPDGN